MAWGGATLLPLSMPLATLLASVMTLGQLSENNVKTRDLLIQTAGKLFTHHGVKGVQAKDIAQAANAVPNAITYHFGGLDNLIDAVWEHALSNIDYGQIENYYEKNQHLLKTPDGKRQLISELIDIFFKMIWNGDDESHWEIAFLLNASITDRKSVV